MSLTSNIIINSYSIIMLIVMYIYSAKHSFRESFLNKLFIMMLQITILMLVLDMFSRFDGNTNSLYPVLNYFGNLLVFLLSYVMPSIWLLYVHYQIYNEKSKTLRLLYPLIALNAGNVVMVILSQYYGWYYHIDANNIYHRGPLFWVATFGIIALILVTLALIIVNRDKIKEKNYFPLLFFAIPLFAAVFMQVLFYGISIILNSVVISLFVVFLNIQNQSLNTDYLTGVNNRKILDAYLKQKINAASEGNGFSVIMLDLDDFKQINDTFGHDMGDYALDAFVKLLKSCIRSKDFIARFGGDEFYIILGGVTKIKDIKETVKRINSCIDQYNESRAQPFWIGCSIGYAVYDSNCNMNVKEFQKYLDMLMYENKRANQELKNQG